MLKPGLAALSVVLVAVASIPTASADRADCVAYLDELVGEVVDGIPEAPSRMPGSYQRAPVDESCTPTTVSTDCLCEVQGIAPVGPDC